MSRQADEHPAKGLARFLTIEGLWAGFLWLAKPLVPITAAAVTAVSGFFQHVPLWQLVPASALAFAGAIYCVNGWDAMASRRNIKNKIAIEAVAARPIVRPGDVEQSGLQAYIQFVNLSELALEYDIAEIHTTVGDRFSADKNKDLKRKGLIEGYGSKTFLDAAVNLDWPLDLIEGTFRVKILYGLPGKRDRETLTASYRTIVGPPVFEGQAWRFEAYEHDGPL